MIHLLHTECSPDHEGEFYCLVYLPNQDKYSILKKRYDGHQFLIDKDEEIMSWEENKDLTVEDKVKYFNEHINQINDAFNGTVIFEGLDGIDICNSFYELLYKYQYFYYSGYVASIDDKFIIRINR